MIPQYWTHESEISNTAVLYFRYAFQPHQVISNSGSYDADFYYEKILFSLSLRFLSAITNTVQESNIDSEIAEIAADTHSAASDSFLVKKLAAAGKILLKRHRNKSLFFA